MFSVATHDELSLVFYLLMDSCVFVLLLACLLHFLAKQCNFIQVYFCNHVKFKIGLKINLTIKLKC